VLATAHASPRDPVPWVHRESVVNGVRLHYVDAGEGPLVVLLHGFPDFWYTWRHQIPPLVRAGYRVVAPDLRGYNTSDKPSRVGSYRMNELVGDVVGLISRCGERRAVVVGHDWGGAIAWHAAMRHPKRVERLIILNAPHPTAFLQRLGHFSQLRRSWYMIFFQLPWLPETLLRAGGFAAVERILRSDAVRSDAITDEEMKHYRRALGQRGALTGMLNYYRAAFHPRSLDRKRSSTIIEAPTLLIWGKEDRFLEPALTDGVQQWVPNLRVERIAHAGHWVHSDAPERVSHLMLDFLRTGLPRLLRGQEP